MTKTSSIGAVENSSHANEISAGERFAFGENWRRFLATLSDERIQEAADSLKGMLGVASLAGATFLDVGSGSGLFSLAARKLGARVHSFDYDPQSVACTEELRKRYFPDDPHWRVEHGSALDPGYLDRLGKFDVVYSWGVLHHTGRMMDAFSNVTRLVKPGGALYIAIYNDQGIPSRYWLRVKRLYNRGGIARVVMIAVHTPYLLWVRKLVRLMRGRGPLERGMSLWHDMIDWLGGYPFEVASPELVFAFFRARGFSLQALKTCGGRMGCNEFVFRHEGAAREP